jgi:sensor histidine kinase YesM
MSKTLHKELIDKNGMLQFFISSKYRLYRHLIMILFISLTLYKSDPEYTEPTETISRIVALLLFLVLVYSNMYFLVPKLLFKKKYGAYVLSILAVTVISVFIRKSGQYFFVANVKLDPYKEDVGAFPFSFIIFIIISASAAIKLFQQWMLDAQLINELQEANTNAELEQLKNQINPHFLFNMLNNANVLTKKDPEKASLVLMKLSDLLRYQLYDSAREKVFLTSDIHFLEDFLNLEKVRRDNFDFLISKEGNLSGVQIPPLLFISFVENAVKHNNDSEKRSYVNLFFDVRNNELFFKCVNSKPILKAVNSGSGGLGLVNIKRRLELLFPSLHLLEIEDNPETYCVTLTIKL